jgi:hypothetical protein
MRTIQVSTEVFAAIWAARQPGENNEDDTLRRVLHVPQAPPSPSTSTPQGWTQKRFNVSVPEGFRIERNYKGTDYEAEATGGSWKLLNTGMTYPSLTALSEAIQTGIENVWANWYYTDEQGKRRPVSDLRDPQTIRKRGS